MNTMQSRVSVSVLALFGTALLVLNACEGERGPAGPQGPAGPGATTPTRNQLEQGEDIPGLVVTILSLTGGTASGGNFRAGDTPTVNYRLQKNDGSDWDIDELSVGKALLSGPTSNYQRVIAEQVTVVAGSTPQADGSYSYTFPTPIPASYLAPYFDTPSFGPEDGELTGQPLLDGTYTVGLTFGWNFTVDGQLSHDTGNATFDFLVGTAGVIEPREVIKLENCNRCHERLLVHGDTRQDVKMCVLCHTAGAEDSNLLGATPGVTIDFSVLIHKLHTGKHLPSVLGVSTNTNGSRNYAATPQPYVVAGVDFSAVGFPAWPQGIVAMPRDQGYTALSSTDKAKEDEIRKGPSNCAVCHGDPDGSGPATAPAQGDFHKTKPTRQACGSCHDDVIWGQNYTANGQTMGAQANNSNCALCHEVAGNGLAVHDAHLHPNLDPAFDAGLNMTVTNVAEAGTHNNDGTIDPGEKIRFRLRITDDAGANVLPTAISAPSLVIAGPTSNYNLLLNTSIPTAAITGTPPFDLNVPMKVDLEPIGVSTGGIDSFATAFTPHLNVTNALTSVFERTATSGGNTTLAADSGLQQNYIDVDNATNFARDDYIVVDDTTLDEEYVRIQFVQGNRLWFSSPSSSSYKAGLARAHLLGATVKEVTLATRTTPGQFSVVAATGTIVTVAGQFTAGNPVIASYTTDFVMPALFPVQLNDTPDLDESSGEWRGKPIVDGTYTIGIWSSRSLTLSLFGESNSYRSTSESENVDFLVGAATTQVPYNLISSGTNCYDCHQELAFHGNGRRSFESCILCHGTAGSEDRPQYVAANAPATPGVSVSFRTMLHKIHMGEHLSNAATYDIVAHSSSSYPNNFSVANFAEVVFPAVPGGTQNCNRCHGNDAWHEPKPRAHPTEQFLPVKRWAAVCGACHDSSDALAHIAAQTDPSGSESCGVCHGPGKSVEVQRVHKPY